MENHGLVTLSREGIKGTLMLVELLELSAKSILLALTVGQVKELKQQDVKDLGNTMRTRSLPLFGALAPTLHWKIYILGNRHPMAD